MSHHHITVNNRAGTSFSFPFPALAYTRHTMIYLLDGPILFLVVVVVVVRVSPALAQPKPRTHARSHGSRCFRCGPLTYGLFPGGVSSGLLSLCKGRKDAHGVNHCNDTGNRSQYHILHIRSQCYAVAAGKGDYTVAAVAAANNSIHPSIRPCSHPTAKQGKRVHTPSPQTARSGDGHGRIRGRAVTSKQC